MSQNVLGDVGNWANTLLSWSATSRPQLLFCVRACFALSVSGGLTDRQVLLAPNYRWLDQQERSTNGGFWESDANV
jgi:hypothetical protein